MRIIGLTIGRRQELLIIQTCMNYNKMNLGVEFDITESKHKIYTVITEINQWFEHTLHLDYL